jgi:hypothetical protein
MAGKNKYVFIDAELAYAKVFETNRDMGNPDKGVDYSETDGIYSVDLLVTDEVKAQMIAGGVPEKAGAFEQFKPTNDGRWKFKARRKHKHEYWTEKTEDGEDTGRPVVFGPPKVFDYNAAENAWMAAEKKGGLNDYITPWTIDDGLLGNGTKAKVKLKVESGVGVMGKAKGKPWSRVVLDAIAITELSAYDAGGVSNNDWF